MKLGQKKCNHRTLNGMFRLWGKIQNEYLSKFMYDNSRDSMIVNFTENRFLQQVQKINSQIETDLGFIMLLKGNLPPKMYSYGNILPINYLSYLSFNQFLSISVLLWETFSWCLPSPQEFLQNFSQPWWNIHLKIKP